MFVGRLTLLFFKLLRTGRLHVFRGHVGRIYILIREYKGRFMVTYWPRQIFFSVDCLNYTPIIKAPILFKFLTFSNTPYYCILHPHFIKKEDKICIVSSHSFKHLCCIHTLGCQINIYIDEFITDS